MKIHYIVHDNIDKKKWDECITGSFNGIVFAYSWYLDVASPGWDALVLEDYHAVMPLTKRSKFGIKYLYQPFFTSQYGVFSVEKMSKKLVNDFLANIPRVFKLVEISLNTFNKADQKDFSFEELQTFELDLIRPYEEIRSFYSKNTKRNIKKAQKNGIQVMKNLRPELVIDLFKENRGKFVKTYKKEDYLRLQRLIYEMVHRQKAEVWGAYTSKNELCAGAFFAGSNHKAFFLFSGINDSAKQTGAMPYLIDHFIKENSNEHLTLDFNGSQDPNIARFYKGFGAKRCTFLFAKRKLLPWFLKPLKK